MVSKGELRIVSMMGFGYARLRLHHLVRLRYHNCPRNISPLLEITHCVKQRLRVGTYPNGDLKLGSSEMVNGFLGTLL